MSKIDLTNVGSGYNRSRINTNFQKIEDDLNQKVLYRDPPAGTENAMKAQLDMGNRPIINLGAPISQLSAARIKDLEVKTVNVDNEVDLIVDVKNDLIFLEPQPYEYIRTRGFHTPGDGGGSLYQALPFTDFKGILNEVSNITAANGLIITLVVKDTVDLRSFGAIADYDFLSGTGTDNTDAIQTALASSLSDNKLYIDGGGLSYGMESGCRWKERGTFIQNALFYALDGWDAGTIDTDLMTGNNALQGNPMFRMDRDNTPYTGREFYDVGFYSCSFDGRNQAPVMYLYETRNARVDDCTVAHCYKYGVAWLTKNGRGEMNGTDIFEYAFGEGGYNDPSMYTANGLHIRCADIHINDVVVRYCKYPIWTDNTFNVQFSGAHPYNGNAVSQALPGWYVGPDMNGIIATNTYMDNCFLEMRSFNHVFSGGRFVKTSASSNQTLARLIAGTPTDAIEGLFIDGFNSGSGNFKTVAIDTPNGNNFTGCNNSRVHALCRKESALSPREGYLTSKRKRENIASNDWIPYLFNDVEYYYFDIDIESLIALPDVYTEVKVDLKDESTATLLRDPIDWSYQFEPNGGAGTKFIRVFANKPRNCEVSVYFSEGFSQAI